MRARYPFILICLCLLTSGCANHRYGYDTRQWNEFSAEQQAAAKKEYEFIIDARRRQKHEDVIDARKQSIIDFANQKTIY